MLFSFKLSYFMRLLLVFFLVYITSSCLKESEPIAVTNSAELNGTFMFQGNKRTYIIRLPKNYSSLKELPMVVFLHGGNGNAKSVQSFTNFGEVADRHGFILLYPQGFYEASENSFIWADGRGLAPDKMGIDDVGFVTNLVNSIGSSYKVNNKKVYLSGFSNGGFLAQRIAFKNNVQFAAIATLGSSVTKQIIEGPKPSRAIPSMFIFGSDDPLVPYKGGIVSGSISLPVVGIEQLVNFWVEQNQCKNSAPIRSLSDVSNRDNSTVTIANYSGGINNTEVEFYKVLGGGHTFPGVPSNNKLLLGETNLDFQANETIWQFFNKYQL
jgi:polyhydroxybutyrate depolymerase